MAQSSMAYPPLTELPLTEDELERARRIDFTVDRESELPLGTQLGWKIRGMIARGALRSGDRLPSVRELAGFAGVNVNTARAVYDGLEEDGLLNSEHGRGTFVTNAAAELRELDPIASEALAQARAATLDPSSLIATIYSAMAADAARELPPDPFPSIDPAAEGATLRRELRAQISRLERELAQYAWHDPRQPFQPGPVTAQPVGRVAGVEELERMRGEMIDRLSRLRGEAEQRGVTEQRARAHVEEMISDPSAHRWEMITADQTGDPGCKSWRVVPSYGPLGAIMGWWRVKVSSGCPLAAPLAAASGITSKGRAERWSDP